LEAALIEQIRGIDDAMLAIAVEQVGILSKTSRQT